MVGRVGGGHCELHIAHLEQESEIVAGVGRVYVDKQT